MKYKVLSLALLALLIVAFVTLPQMVSSEERKLFIPDKALCAKMLRFGKQAYMRGKYLDAKEYFRKAVQADPASLVAWRYYDLAAVFALAEKVEQDASLIAPGTSTRGEAVPGTPSAPPPAPKVTPGKKGAVKMEEEEGC
ncbi:MAG: hypothetical protein PVH82_04250 [Desulfobacteraceae bacterium]|jgi:tetratricopeptide (TPR) repeat protein